MGESKRRADPELVEITNEATLAPSNRSLRRVQLAIARAQGAGAVAQAAQQVAQNEQAAMIEAVANIAEADGWILPKAPVIHLDAEAGTLTILTPEAYESKQGGAARGLELQERANGHSTREPAPVAPGEAHE